MAAFALIGPCVKLFSLPRGILMPMILPVCVIGAYAARLSMVDVWIMLISGYFGYLLHVFKFPVAPIVLGVILAPLADENLRRALMVSQGSFMPIFQRPVSLILFLIIVWTIVSQFPIVRKGKDRLVKRLFKRRRATTP